MAIKFPINIPDFPPDTDRHPLETSEVLRRMRLALPKGAQVWARWSAEQCKEVVIRDGWFGNRCVIQSFAWFHCYEWGSLEGPSDGWYSYGSLPGINQEGADWPERMAQAAWKRIHRVG